MKLDKFIKETCCNYVRSECIGVWNRSLFSDTYICHPIDKEEPLPCNFFEKIVLPAAIKLGCHEKLVDQYSEVDFGVVKRTKAVRAKEAKKPVKTKKKRQKR